MNHYNEAGLTSEEYEAEYKERTRLTNEELVFGDVQKYTYTSLDSLEGIVNIGVGKDAQESREDYLEKLSMLISELQCNQAQLLLGTVDLTYTNVGEA